ncbi:MAG: diacylglycerol kinase family protein [Candidatus Acidiferrales bacterium]
MSETAHLSAERFVIATKRFIAIVNPAAGGGRSGELATAVLERVRRTGVELTVVMTTRPGQATDIARKAFGDGIRNFMAVGGDGTAFEILNGLFPEATSCGRPALGFLPLGTGNSFLKDFTSRGVEHTIEALQRGTRRPCDVIRLRHSGGELYFLNLLTLGFPADVAETANRRFKRWGELGYIFAVFMRLMQLEHLAFPHKLEGGRASWDRGKTLFLSINNSKFTGGKMMIAPQANPCDGLIEYVRWGPIGRLGLIGTLPRLFTGTHINHRLATRAGVRRIEFELDAPVSVMVDGESMRLQCQSVEVLPGALDVIV